ncbi:hypothetical protein V6N13_135512 [Hibiscus sabdariffa]
MVVSVPVPLWNPCIGTAIWVPVRFESGIGTDTLVSVWSVLRLGRVEEIISAGIRARPRRGVRGGGQAPVHLDEVQMEQGNEETLPPPPPVGGEANEGGVGP